MNREAQSSQISQNGKSEVASGISPVMREQINLLHNLQYIILNKATIKNGDNIEFAKDTQENSKYPRFHLVLSTMRQPEIIKFHIDENPHKTMVNFEMREIEIKRLIREIEETEKRASQDEEREKIEARKGLLCLFRSELLFGNVREVDKIGDREKRWDKLYAVKNFKYLKGIKKHSWMQRKQLSRESSPETA